MGKGIEEEEKMNQRDGENRVDKCNFKLLLLYEKNNGIRRIVF